jgi:hypothetical protein
MVAITGRNLLLNLQIKIYKQSWLLTDFCVKIETYANGDVEH